MDMLLIAVAVISLTLALGMAYVLVRLVREERQRTDARVAVLTELSAEQPAVAATPHMRVPRTDSRAASAGDVQIRPSSSTAAITGDIFAERPASSPWRGRFAAMGALAIIIVAGAIAVSQSHESGGARVPQPAAAATNAPLELLSLRYAQEADKMTITGLVQNPRGSAVLSHVTVTAFLFAADGTFVASGRAPLDFTTLGAGDESPFVISVPVSAAVARYRVGFRDRDGRVIAHVDRRVVGTLADRRGGSS